MVALLAKRKQHRRYTMQRVSESLNSAAALTAKTSWSKLGPFTQSQLVARSSMLLQNTWCMVTLFFTVKPRTNETNRTIEFISNNRAANLLQLSSSLNRSEKRSKWLSKTLWLQPKKGSTKLFQRYMLCIVQKVGIKRYPPLKWFSLLKAAFFVVLIQTVQPKCSTAADKCCTRLQKDSTQKHQGEK